VNLNKYVEEGICTRKLIAVLLRIAKIWNQPRCPLADKWVKTMLYIYSAEYYSSIKTEITICSNMDGTGKHCVK
jgi:hypothetical protein